ncbi:homeobox-leucine zipper protein ROC2-like [Argentina anserina]|uniref:homeobox-leucine zipper protein ROC2-like n=1 Tax=Argentina anserina TaxID=57926 RepID=UPI00217651C1|nr:homeobox-leucine zipper protein ROC2-like [Potentilla anserina]
MKLPELPPPSQQVFSENMGSYVQVASNISRASDLLMAVTSSAEVNRMKIIDLALEAMEELNKLALAREPLWQYDTESNTEFLSDVEYMREFGHISASLKEIIRMVEVGDSQSELPRFRNINDSEFSVESEYGPMSIENQPEKPVSSETSRAIEYVNMKAVHLVHLLMDLKQWLLVFPNIVSRANIVGVLSSSRSEGNYDGTLQVMTAEFHAPTPLIPARESYFARYSKQLDRDMWVVVDVSLEDLFQFPSTNFRRQPSGCIIQQMPNGCSKVIWVERVEVDNRMVHNMFKTLVSSGFAFSAKRWVSALVRQCEWLATLNSTSSPTSDCMLISKDGRNSLLKLSERMMRSFVADISASIENKWKTLPVSGAEDVKVTTKTSLKDPGKPPGTTLLFATSVHLPVPRTQVYNLLRSGETRFMWDMMSYEKDTREIAYIASGDHTGNRVSIIEVENGATKEIEVFYLQESYTDLNGSYVVYAPIDQLAMSALLDGVNPDEVPILASGFSILPDRPMANIDESGGSLLTLALHITEGGATEEFIPPSTVQTILHIIAGTVIQITHVLSNDGENSVEPEPFRGVEGLYLETTNNVEDQEEISERGRKRKFGLCDGGVGGDLASGDALATFNDLGGFEGQKMAKGGRNKSKIHNDDDQDFDEWRTKQKHDRQQGVTGGVTGRVTDVVTVGVTDVVIVGVTDVVKDGVTVVLAAFVSDSKCKVPPSKKTTTLKRRKISKEEVKRKRRREESEESDDETQTNNETSANDTENDSKDIHDDNSNSEDENEDNSGWSDDDNDNDDDDDDDIDGEEDDESNSSSNEEEEIPLKKKSIKMKGMKIKVKGRVKEKISAQKKSKTNKPKEKTSKTAPKAKKKSKKDQSVKYRSAYPDPTPYKKKIKACSLQILREGPFGQFFSTIYDGVITRKMMTK